MIYAKKGTSFLAIAQQYNVPLSRIFEFNDLQESEALAKDQLIYLQRKRKTGNNEFHIVKTGETLYDIAQEEAIRMESLLEYNQLQNNMQPAVGQQLYLEQKHRQDPAGNRRNMQDEHAFAKNDNAIAQENAITANRTSGYITHTVQPKETIYSISKKYNVKIDDLVNGTS